MKNNRFLNIYKEGSSLSGDGIRNILVDTKTGINYLWITSGYSAALTPLLDSDGKVIVSKLPVEEVNG